MEEGARLLAGWLRFGALWGGSLDWFFDVVAAAVVGALVGTFLASGGAGALLLFTARGTEGHVHVAGRVRTVDHAVGGRMAGVAATDDGGFFPIDGEGDSLVEDVANAPEAIAVSLLSIADDAALEVVDMGDFFDLCEVVAGFFAFDA